MSTWPTTLPPPSVSGYGLQPVDPTVRTDMEFGATRARRRSHARADRVTVSWLFTDSEMQTFRQWFDDDAGAAGGAAWFNIDLPTGNGGITTVEARFAQVFEGELKKGLHWIVRATLEVR